MQFCISGSSKWPSIIRLKMFPLDNVHIFLCLIFGRQSWPKSKSFIKIVDYPFEQPFFDLYGFAGIRWNSFQEITDEEKTS